MKTEAAKAYQIHAGGGLLDFAITSINMGASVALCPVARIR